MKSLNRIALAAAVLAVLTAGVVSSGGQYVRSASLSDMIATEPVASVRPTATATAAPVKTGFSCDIVMAPSSEVRTLANPAQVRLQSIGTLTVTAPSTKKDAFKSTVASFVPAGQTSVQYFAISAQPADLSATPLAKTGLDDSGAGSCFAINPVTDSAQLVTLSPIQEVITSPQSGANLSLSQLTSFKASLKGVDADRYTMYWQVDNDQYNLMSNDAALSNKITARGIDLTGWNWRASGPYKVKFIAKDKAGKTIAQNSVTIWVTP